jgi:hypothetical protein
MPKNEIDYSNTIIYKITCKDSNVNDVYVGHTTNFVQRKHAHKQSCINIKSLNYKCKVYEVIRNNGGWNNWSMEIINFFNCRDHYEARQKEQEYFVLLNATLNSIEPMPKPKFKPIKATEKIIKNTFYCEKCNTHCDTAKLFEIHNNTKKHMKQNETKIVPNSSNNYICNCCNYKTSRLSQYERHLLTDKHSNHVNETNMKHFSSEKFQCICGILFKSRTTLWRHTKVCNQEEKITNNETPDKELIMMLVKQNSQLFEQNNEMLEIIKNGTHNTNNSHNNNTTNSHNKAFNLNFFLNETCKDAMNIMDFVDSIKLQLSDLEKVGELGYIEGISKIIVKNLKELDVTQRPVHCTDKKRETMYIKDEDKWEKEEEDKKKLRRAIKRVAFKNQNLIQDFKKENPDYNKYHSKMSDKYNKIIFESMGGPGDNDKEKEDKIIKNISNVTIVNKE